MGEKSEVIEKRYQSRDNGGREIQCAYMPLDLDEAEKASCRVNAQGPCCVQPIAVQNPPQVVLMIHAIGEGLVGFVRSFFGHRPASHTAAEQASPRQVADPSVKHRTRVSQRQSWH
jgi:hypothetical protein